MKLTTRIAIASALIAGLFAGQASASSYAAYLDVIYDSAFAASGDDRQTQDEVFEAAAIKYGPVITIKPKG